MAIAILVVAAQWMTGAYSAEFLEDADEPAHYVTGLMVRDYLAAGAPWPPMAFAERFSEHYPRVALGHWPPVFYLIEGAWMLVFGDGRLTVLLLMALLTAIWALLTGWIVHREFEGWTSAAAVLLLLATPAVVIASRMVMAEILVALLTLAALWTLGRLIEEPSWTWSLAFSGLAAAALLTKGTGILLAPLAPLAVLTMRRWALLRSPWLWLPAILVIAVCLPWYLFAPFALHEKMAKFGDLGERPWRVGHTLRHFAAQQGWVLLLLATAGWIRIARRIIAGAAIRPFWVVAFWTIPVIVAFRVLVGAWETKHLITAAPLLLLFAASGFQIVRDSSARGHRLAAFAIAVAVVLEAGSNLLSLPQKSHVGLDWATSRILNGQEFEGRELLVVSSAQGEGAFVAEVAMADQRPGRRVRRGYKVLTEYTRMGQIQRMRFGGTEDLQRHLLTGPPLALILAVKRDPDPHVQLTMRMLEEFPDRWRAVLRVNGPMTIRGYIPRVP